MREMENTRALPACSRLSNILLGRARLEIELCPLIEMINCLTSATALGAPRHTMPRRAAPDCLFTNRKYENVRNRARRSEPAKDEKREEERESDRVIRTRAA